MVDMKFREFETFHDNYIIEGINLDNFRWPERRTAMERTGRIQKRVLSYMIITVNYVCS